jgi:hypothetical protein
MLEQLTAAAAAPNGGSGADHHNGHGNGNGAPVVGYDGMTADQVIALVASGALTEAQLEIVLEYESAHANRKTVLDRLARVL